MRCHKGLTLIGSWCNQGSIALNTLCYEDIVTTGNQFYITPYHYNKEVCAMGNAKVVYIRSAHNLADVLTKAIKRGVLRALRDKLLGYDPYTDEDALAHSEEKNSD